MSMPYPQQHLAIVPRAVAWGLAVALATGCAVSPPPRRAAAAPPSHIVDASSAESIAPNGSTVPTAPTAPTAPSDAGSGPAPADEPPKTGAITAEPIARASRLAPCRVEIEHTFRHTDDVTWLTRRTPAYKLVRDWGQARWDVRWEVDPIAPIPLTLEQARTLLPDAHIEQYSSGTTWIWAFVGDGNLVYDFDAQGRTTRVNWDPVADSAVYVFHYQYRCGAAHAGARRPGYADDTPAPP
jgi:hypothetical protein